MARRKSPKTDFTPLFFIGGAFAFFWFLGRSKAVAVEPITSPQTRSSVRPFLRLSLEKVKWIQSSLNQILGATMPVDGSIGPVTQAAVRQFQSLKGLAVDGVVGPQTEMALKQELDSPTLWGGGIEDL